VARTWELGPTDLDIVRRVAHGANVPEVVARLLVNRGHTDPAAVGPFLESSLQGLHDPDSLPDMEPACERLERAVRDGETILIHGDYDVDGVTGTALLVRLFQLIGAKVDWHIPDRMKDGYSFGDHSVAKAREVGASVVVSVDNGTSAAETIAQLKEVGIDTIVTDHHEPPSSGVLPPAIGIVNPKLDTSEYPFRELCGAGVAFKLAWGVARRISGARRVRDDLKQFLAEATAYVALATVCDVVPLVGENRVLARRGLTMLGSAPTPGLQSLLAVAKLTGRRLLAEDVGYKIGPRINAAGRVGTARAAIELLLTQDDARARELATKLDEMNTERRRIEAEILEQAVEAAAAFDDPARHPVLVIAGQGWHQGVVGIVAARIVRRFGRPALVIGLDGETGRGSARSLPGFDVLGAMEGGADHMLRFGGHEMAAGCEVRADAIDALRAAVCTRANEMLAGAGHPEPRLRVDLELPLAHMGEDLMRAIDRLEPFGQGNKKPHLYSPDVRLASPPRAVGDGTHLILNLREGDHTLRAMAFGMAARQDELQMGQPLHVVYTPRWNFFRGLETLEATIHDFRVGARPELRPRLPAPSAR
jgi:single-stranded-DNA-specific exonuclease